MKRYSITGNSKPASFKFNIWFFIMLVFMTIPQKGICAETHESEVIKVGSELDFPPYAFVDDKGQAAGFSIDLIHAVADAMGLKIEISTGTWNAIWNDLVQGRLDVLPIVARVPGREKLVNFSVPHTETFDCFFVRSDHPMYKNLSEASGKEIVVKESDASQHELENRNFKGKIIHVSTLPEGLSLVASGKHDAMLCSKLVGTLILKKNGIKGITAGPPIPDYKRVFSFAVKKGNAELLEKLNQGLLIIKTNGEYDRIYEKWLSTENPWLKYKKYLLPAIAAVLLLIFIFIALLVVFRLQVRNRTLDLHERNLQLEESRNDLIKHRDHLEDLVRERTAELEQDIARRKILEEQFRESEHRSRAYLDVSGQIGWITRANGLAEDLPDWRKYTGQSLEEVKGWNWLDAVHPDDREKTAVVWNKAIAEKSIYENEYRVRRYDGIYRCFFARGMPTLEEDGTIREWVGICIDIDDRKKMRNSLGKQSNFWKTC